MSSDQAYLTDDLPDPEAARRFLSLLEERHPREKAKLIKNDGLLSDAVTLAAYSPLLSTTLLQNPEYLWWLNRKKNSPSVRTKDELMEALGRFVLTHSQLDLHTQLARFRRRELLRIFLSDIRRLATIAEITEDISNLADAILETALRSAEQEMDNRFGKPQTNDEKGRSTAAEFCIVSLGKLGSRELNYASDIDLLFLYSEDGHTSGTGTRGSVTNREYFVKLGEAVVQLVGKQTGEGAAYRVDMRLRPHGRVGALAISVDDAVRYYTTDARDWERQVLIRSRPSAGDPEVYKDFFKRVESTVFSKNVTVETALESVRLSKQSIDREQKSERGFNVKLGRGGIREIEFLAQALQLAHGGRDRWLRAPHTLISLSRLCDRNLISEAELTELFGAYEFLRQLEHVLQMESGLQTHTVPDDDVRRNLVARRMGLGSISELNSEINKHSGNTHRIFERVFAFESAMRRSNDRIATDANQRIVRMDDGGGLEFPSPPEALASTTLGARISTLFRRHRYQAELETAIDPNAEFGEKLGRFRRAWSRLHTEIKNADMDGEVSIRDAKNAQTALAEASIDTALEITRHELVQRYRSELPSLPVAVMGLGKLGGAGIDYDSDLDLVLLYDDRSDIEEQIVHDVTAAEFFGRAAEIFVTTLSSMTRDGSIYRVDLRLRPYGTNGQSIIGAGTFADYMRDSAAIWEWLAYVKLRAVGGDISLAADVESHVREIIHSRAKDAGADQLASETRRVRLLLEKEKAGRRRSNDIDIKYGLGGMLDVYFSMRYLQLRDNVPDNPEDRSTDFMLRHLYEVGSLTAQDHETLLYGYRFLSSLDHHLRLAVGRTTRLPIANQKALELISQRMDLESSNELIERLTIHRLNIRNSFDNVVGSNVTVREL